MNNKELYKHLDNVTENNYKKINDIINNSRFTYKKELLKQLSKKLKFDIESKYTKKIAKNIFSSIDELNIIMYNDISRYYYNEGIKLVKKIVDNEVNDIYNENNVEDYLLTFIHGKGLDYNYKDEMIKRESYFDDRMTNVMLGVIANKLVGKEIKKSIASSVNNAFNMYDIQIKQMLNAQKRGIANVIDNTGTFIAIKSMQQAYKDNNIQKFIRHAEIDDRTCSYCQSVDMKVYNHESEIDIPSHISCRCWYEPLKTND